MIIRPICRKSTTFIPSTRSSIPHVPLGDYIRDSLINGVSPQPTEALIFDDTDTFDVDPLYDIKTDKFDAFERGLIGMEELRSAPNNSSTAADAAVSTPPTEGQTPPLEVNKATE